MEKKYYFHTGIIVKSLFLLVLMLDAIPFLYDRYGGYVKIFLAVCLLYLGIGILLQRSTFKSRFIVLLLLFSFSYLITIILNRASYFSENMKQLIYMTMIFLLFYGYDARNDISMQRYELHKIAYVYEAAAFILALACLFTYFLRIDLTYYIGESQLQIGMYDNRLWGVYNPNTGSGIAMVALYISIYQLMREQSLSLIVIHAVSSMTEIILLVLSGSRAPLALSVVGSVFIIVSEYWRRTERSGVQLKQRRLKCLGSLIFILFCFFMLKPVMTEIPGKLVSVQSVASVRARHVEDLERYLGIERKEPDKKKNTLTAKVDLTRKEKEEERPGGTLTGRTELWDSGFECFIKHPVWGVGREGLYDACEPFLEDKTWQGSLYYGGLHNIVLTILVSSGFVGMSIMGVFLLLVFSLIFRVVIKGNILLRMPEFNLCLAVFLSMGAVEMLEARILYRVGVFVPLFWMFTGWLVRLCELDEQERKNA